MPKTKPCPTCSHPNEPNAKFCLDCGGSMSGTSPCSSCGAPVKLGSEFCSQCGTSCATASDIAGGSITQGEWKKDGDELVRRISNDQMRGQLVDPSVTSDYAGGFFGFLRSLGRSVLNGVQSRSMKVPVGSVGVVMVDGEVVKVLAQGTRTTVGMFAQFAQGGKSDPVFYLIDSRPVPFELQINALRGVQSQEAEGKRDMAKKAGGIALKVAGGAAGGAMAGLAGVMAGEALAGIGADKLGLGDEPTSTKPTSTKVKAVTVSIVTTVSIICGSDDTARANLTRFINEVVKDADVLRVGVLHAIVRPIVERVSRDNLLKESSPTNYAAVAGKIKEALGRQFGLTYHVEVAPIGSVVSVDLRLGKVITPDLEPCYYTACVEPKGQVRFGALYCPECGRRQPTRAADDKGKVVGGERLMTADAELVELDLVLRVSGDREVSNIDYIESAVATGAARIIRNMTYEAIATPEGFRAIQEAVVGAAEAAVTALQFTLLDLIVLDCRNKNGEWAMAARAEINRAQTEIEVAREWFAIEKDNLAVDQEHISIEQMAEDVKIRREQMALDVALRRHVLLLDDNFQTAQADRADELRTLNEEITHARTLDDEKLTDREQRQDQADRGATVDVAEATRDASTASAIDNAARTHDRHMRDQDHADTMKGDEQAHTEQMADDGRRRTRESDELTHQAALEDQSAEHDEKQARRAMGLSSDSGRLDADDQDYRAQKEQDRSLAGRAGIQKLEEESVDADHGRRVDLIKLEQEQEAAERTAQLEFVKAKTEAEAAAQASINESVSQMSTEQIMAAAMQKRSLTDAEAAALGGKEALEQRLGDKDEHNAQMMEMMAQLAAQKNADSDRQADLTKEMLRAMSAATGQAATISAHQQNAEQATKMASSSVAAMAQVAAAKAKSSGPPVIVCVAEGCGEHLDVGAKYCSACRAKQ